MDIETHLRNYMDIGSDWTGPHGLFIQAADTIAALRKQVSDAVGALEPFSDFAGELFARNYNKTDKVASVKGVTAFGNELEVSLTFLAFLNARRTLATLTGGKADA